MNTIDDSTVQRLLNEYSRNPKTYELEARLGHFEMQNNSPLRFVAGVLCADFHRMLKFHKHHFRSEVSTTTQRINGQMRYEKERIMKKESIDRLDVPDYDIRISLCRETVQSSRNSGHLSIMQVFSCTREKKRTSCFISPELRLDFTEVNTTQGDALDGPQTTYEVELEVIRELPVATFRYAIDKLLQHWRNTNYVIPNSSRAAIERSFCHLVGVKTLKSFAGAQPRTMQTGDLSLLHSPYAFTMKMDGLRNYMYITHRGMVILVAPGESTMKQIGALDTSDFDDTILDGELANTFHAFDALYWKGFDLRGCELYNTLHSRLNLIHTLLMTTNSNLFIMKKYYFSNSLEDMQISLSHQVSAPRSDDAEIDGVIFVPANECYPKSKYWKGLLKWKHRVTIDFRMYADDLLFVTAGPKEIQFKPECMPHAGRFIPMFTQLKYTFGDIYECYWEPNLRSFVPIKHRVDKHKPNYITIALDNFYAINNPVTLPMLTGEEYIPGGQEVSVGNRKETYMLSVTDAVNFINASAKNDGSDDEFPVCTAAPTMEIPISMPASYHKRVVPFTTPATPPRQIRGSDESDEENSEIDDDNTVPPSPIAVESPESESTCSDEEESDEEEPPVVVKKPTKKPGKVVKRKRTPEPTITLFGKPLKQWRLVDLKAACAERKLKVRGKKAILIEHLQNWQTVNGSE